MAVYQIYQFDDVPLPLYNPSAMHDAGPVASTLRDSLGGAFDVYGSRRRLPSTLKFSISGIYAAADGDVLLVSHDGTYIVDHAGIYILTATAKGYLRRQVDAIRAKMGVRGTIYRRRWDDTTVVQWKTARLLRIAERGEAEQRAMYAKLDLEFETAHAAWRSATAVTVSKTLVSGGAVGANLTAGGNVPVTDAIITVTAAGAITSLAIKALHAGIDLRYTGTLAAGQVLTIDCGAQTVTLNGVNAYAYFALGSGHTVQGWLPMVEGLTPAIVESNGAGTVVISLYDQWV